MQHLLERAHWDANEARAILREYVIEQLGDADALLIVDETGSIKRGRYSAGGKRQYSGTAGRIESSQVGVFPATRAAAAQARAEIIKHLFAHLPFGAYDADEINLKAGAVFAHLYTVGSGGAQVFH